VAVVVWPALAAVVWPGHPAATQLVKWERVAEEEAPRAQEVAVAA
jgi:hypothetical protein